MDKTLRASAIAPVNIALVKYWGKRDVKLNLPQASSLSVTLDDLYTKTTVSFSENTSDRLLINQKQAPEHALRKAQNVLRPLRQLANKEHYGAIIDSTNHVPTGAGLASSASGLAALTLASASALKLNLSKQDLSAIARLGSGSATRSFFGGFVRWDKGEANDGSDSIAQPLFDKDHWPLDITVALISDQKKAISSTEGMALTQKTSPYFKAFIDSVPQDIQQAEQAISERNFLKLTQISERSCLRMHATMMAADPALMYLNAESFRVIRLVKEMRERGLNLFFTADAGPNIKIFSTRESTEPLRKEICEKNTFAQTLFASIGDGARLCDEGMRK